ncbi:zinc ribbon domain-containing protein [Nocardia gipuzkoensis]
MRTSVLPGLGRSAGVDLGMLRPAAVVYSDGDREILHFRPGAAEPDEIVAAALRLVDRCESVWVERLDFGRKTGARAVVLADWREFVAQLVTAAARTGTSVQAVDPRHTSRICPVCGRLGGAHAVQVRIWGCVGCRTPLDRDYAAATAVLLRGEPELLDMLGVERVRQLASARATDVDPGSLYEAELFAQLRRAAYSRRRHVTDPAVWSTVVLQIATEIAATMPTPVDRERVLRMAGAVTEWSWTHITPEGFSEAQARRGRLGAAALRRRRGEPAPLQPREPRGWILTDARREANRARATKFDAAAIVAAAIGQ